MINRSFWIDVDGSDKDRGNPALGGTTWPGSRRVARYVGFLLVFLDPVKTQSKLSLGPRSKAILPLKARRSLTSLKLVYVMRNMP